MKSFNTPARNSFFEIKAPEMVRVPAGYFWMGTSNKQVKYLVEADEWAEDWVNKGLFKVEQPQHQVYVQSFEIGRYPVTNLDYYFFILETNAPLPRQWPGLQFPEKEADYPVVGISLKEALVYCQWISKVLHSPYRLPSEAEWEKAARSSDGRIYPWGEKYQTWRCNTSESGRQYPSATGTYSPGGDSPYGATDMAGNVMEFTISPLRPYPFNETPVRTIKDYEQFVVRGGGWYYSRMMARCAARDSVAAIYSSQSIGFRLARSV